MQRRISGGGNADVWLAAAADADEAALKIIRTRRPDSEPYKRFRREIETLRELGHRSGVLPLIDFELPDGDRPFFSMPVATTMEDALLGASVEQIVEATRDVAIVLAELLAELGLRHRDLKPSNLFRYKGAWVVGDFGLIELPSMEALTAAERFVGPAYFIAFEVMQNPGDVDYAPADVFSLAKSLWVMLVGQRWPAPGEHTADRGPDSLYLLRPHPRSEALDRVVAAATMRDPRRRITMRQFADELTAWLEARDTEQIVPDEISEIAARLRARMAEGVSVAERERRWRTDAGADEAYLIASMQPFYKALRQVRTDFDGRARDDVVRNVLSRASDDGLLWESISIASLDGPGDHPLMLRVGRGLHLYEGGAVCCTGGFNLGFPGESLTQQWATITDPAPAGSLRLRQRIDELAALLMGQLPEWLELFEQGL